MVAEVWVWAEEVVMAEDRVQAEAVVAEIMVIRKNRRRKKRMNRWNVLKEQQKFINLFAYQTDVNSAKGNAMNASVLARIPVITISHV